MAKARRFYGVWVSVLGAILAAAGLLAATALAPGADAQATSVLAGKKIVLDPGHGGSDYGAQFSGVAADGTRYTLLEKQQNLDVAYRLKAILEKTSGATVYMTRTGDETLSNSARADIANRTGAQILVSVHMNGSSNPDTDYTTTLFGN